MSTTRKLDALFYDKGGAVFNVMHSDFGAKGDGVTDDTAAIQAAIDAAGDAGGGEVYFPAGVYGVSSDILVPTMVSLRGAGSRSSEAAGVTIKWVGSGNPTTAVLTANLDGSFARSLQIRGIRVDADGEAVAAQLAGLNETCLLEDFECAGATSYQLVLTDTSGGQRTQHAKFTRIKMTADAGSTGMRLVNVRRCIFDAFTVDTADNDPIAVGVSFESASQNNTFINPHLENCTLPVEIGGNSTGNNNGNLFLNPHLNAPEVTPGNTTVGSDTGTMGVLVRDHETANSNTFIINLRDDFGYAWPVYDAENGVKIPTRTVVPMYTGQLLHSISASTDGLVVTGRTYVQVSTSTADVVIGGLVGGVAGQVVHLHKSVSANTLTIEHNEGAGNQDIQCPRLADIVLTGYGGVTLQCNGTNWFVVSAPTLAVNGTATLSNGNTSVAVTHGLAATPSIHDIQVTPIEAWGNAASFWISTPTSTQFTINVDADPGQDVDFAWRAAIE